VKGKAAHASGLCGKHGGGECDGLDADGGENGQGDGQRASADTGNIVNGKGAFLHDVPQLKLKINDRQKNTSSIIFRKGRADEEVKKFT
jgi:hypothetical protein